MAEVYGFSVPKQSDEKNAGKKREREREREKERERERERVREREMYDPIFWSDTKPSIL